MIHLIAVWQLLKIYHAQLAVVEVDVVVLIISQALEDGVAQLEEFDAGLVIPDSWRYLWILGFLLVFLHCW